MRGLRCAAFVAALGAAMTQARAAWAQIDAGVPGAPAHVVDVTVVGEDQEAARIVDTLRELLGRLGLSVNARVLPPSAALPETPGPTASTRVQIDLRSRAEATVLVLNPGAQAALRRRFGRDASASVLREELADAVRSAVEAQFLVDAARDGKPPVEVAPAPTEAAQAPPPAAPQAPPPPTAAASAALPPEASAPRPNEPAAPAALPTPEGAATPGGPTRGLALSATALAGVGLFASGSGAVPQVGGGLVAASRRGWRPSLTLTAAYQAAFATSDSWGVVAQASSVSVRAIPAVEVLGGPRASLDAGVGAGVDILRVDTGSLPVTAHSFPTTQPDLIASVVVEGHLALTPGVDLTLELAGDADLTPRHYYATQGAARDDVLAPWPVRPVALAGLTVTALGQPRFSGGIFR